MNLQQDSSANDNQIQSNCIRRIMNSTKTLLHQVEENAADLIADDMEISFSEKKSIRPKLRSVQIFLAGTLIGAGSVLGTLKYSSAHNSSDEATAALIQERAAEPQTLTPVAEIDLPLAQEEPDSILAQTEADAEEETEETAAPLQPDVTESFTLKPRQNLSVVLKKGGLTNREIYLVGEALSDVLDVTKIQVGDKVEIGKMNTGADEKSLFSVTIEDRHGNRFIATRNESDFFEASLIEPEVDVKTEYAEGIIDGAFINNAKEAGIPTNVIQQIIWSFDGPVDFSRDLRKGDTFTAVFQKEYNKDGNPTGNGSLLYAEMNLRSKKHERYFYKDSQGKEDYYDENGKIARKLFTMHPLKRPRITSKFGKRKHPILGYTITHWGTDYGAPIGTPIRAPGEGTITQAKRKGSYGMYIQIKHNSEYSTAYAHMSKFHEKSKVGRKVKAGDIIGYVGNTGRSTGPHLHWELIKNGKKINPQTQRITAQRKLTGEELARFYAQRDQMRLNVTGEIAYAKAEPLPEDRKLAYQGPSKSKRVARKAKKSKVQRTASRTVRKNKG